MATKRLDNGLEDLANELETFEEDDQLFADPFGNEEPESPFEDGFSEISDEKITNDSIKKKRPFLRSVVLAILIGGLIGGGALWLVNDPPQEWMAYIEQLLEDEDELESADLQEGALPGLANTSSSELASLADTLMPALMLSEKTEESEPPPRIKKHKYSVQVARCLDQQCVEGHHRLLKRYGLRPNAVTKVESTPVFAVISHLTFTAFKAAQWVKQINQSYHVTGEAFRQREGVRYRIAMGLFPDHKTAVGVHASMNLKFAGQLRFNIKPIQQKTRYYLIRTRSFDSRKQAVALQNRLMEEELFGQVWIITKTYYL